MTRQRLQLDVTESQVRMIDALVEVTGAATRTEMVRRAIETYDYLLDAIGQDAKIVLELPSGEKRELVLVVPRVRKGEA